MYDLLLLRAFFVLILSATAWYLRPFGLQNLPAGGAGLALGLFVVLFELRIRQVSLKRLIGAAAGSVLGIVGAYLISLILSRALTGESSTLAFLQLLILLLMSYVGLIVGANKGEMLNLAALGGLFVDFNLGYVRTGDLNRFGFDAGLGYDFQVTPWLALGPVARYVQIVQADNDRNTDPRDAKLLTVGLDLAFGPAHRESRRDECPAAAECVQQKAPPCPPPPCPDADGDGVCDGDDRFRRLQDGEACPKD